MKVLQIGLSKNRGGIETVIMTYFRALQPRGIIFDFVDIYGEGLAFSDEIESLGGTIYKLPNYKKHPFRSKRLLRKIISNGYEVVHINMLSAANLLPMRLALKEGRTPILHSHNTGTVGVVRKLLHKSNCGKIKQNNVYIIRLACGELAGRWLFKDSFFEVIPNAIDCGKFEFNNDDRTKIRSEHNISDDTILLGFIGRLTAQKNPLYLIHILKATLERGIKNTKLIMVGDGEMRQEVEKTAQTLGVSGQVIFVNNQSDIAPYYSAMDIFVLPSIYEGLAVVAIEAQANGLPCLFSDRITNEVAVSDKVSFLSIDGDASIWAKKIGEVISSPNTRKNIICGTKYDIAVSAEKLEAIYENISKKTDKEREDTL